MPFRAGKSAIVYRKGTNCLWNKRCNGVSCSTLSKGKKPRFLPKNLLFIKKLGWPWPAGLPGCVGPERRMEVKTCVCLLYYFSHPRMFRFLCALNNSVLERLWNVNPH